MRKKYFILLTAVLLFVSCTKKTDILSPFNIENSPNNGPIPIPVNVATVFFIEKDTIYSITNIGDANPTVQKKGAIVNIKTFGPNRSNAFNTVPLSGFPHQRVIYHSFLDRMVVAEGADLDKCYTPSRTNSTISLPNTEQGATVLRIGPDQRLYYFSFGDLGVPRPMELRSIKMDGTDDKTIINYKNQNNPKPPTEGGEINFDKGVLYVPKADGNIYECELKQNGQSKILVPAIFGESFNGCEVRYDAPHEKIFFSSIQKNSHIRRIYSMDVSGNLNTIVKVAEMNYTDVDHLLTFDIIPAVDALVWCKREYNYNTQKHTSVLTKVNLSDMSTKVLKTGNFYINTVVTAMP